MGLFDSGQRSEQRTYATAPAQTYQAILAIASNKPFTMQARDDSRLSCTFKTHVTAFAWGEELLAYVTPAATGSTVSLTVRSTAGYTPLTQMFKNKKDIRTFFETLDQRLGPGSTVAAQ